MNQPRKTVPPFKLGCLAPFMFFVLGGIAGYVIGYSMNPPPDILLCTQEEMNKLEKERIETMREYDCYTKLREVNEHAVDNFRAAPYWIWAGGLSSCFVGSMTLVIGNKISKKIRKYDA